MATIDPPRVIILGASGHGRVALDILRAVGGVAAGFVDRAKRVGEIVDEVPVVAGGAGECTLLRGGVGWFVAVGDNGVRRELTRELRELTRRPAVNLVHPSAVVSPGAVIGAGVFVGPGAVINTGAVIGDGVIVNTGATIDHDARLGEFAQVSPGCHLAGNVHLGELSFLGTGCALIPGVSVGKKAVVGAGSVVVRDIPAGVVAMGCPARVTRSLDGPPALSV